MIEYSETEDFERIAEGGFGIIYKATWNKNGIVAVKKFLNSQDISKDFINELKPFIQYRNRFEHIIKYYDKLTILLEISRGVDCIHNENFIHRDLHSGNILLVNESLSISLSSSTLFNKKQEYTSKDLEFDINNVKRSSLSELNSTTQNSVNNNIQCSNAIYTSRPLNEILPIKQEYSSREIELDINDAQWSPLPGVNSTVQNSLYKIAEIKTETQNNEKLVLQDDLGTGSG
ncbi:unnamed protein product [Rhizophagus irregularis]|uniref:Protein kinase domain-containing protein n=1 Tax=Rhizophagus irregularis TaxID=588596 RepID=A0A915Z324_9GLOM|nr:unnamed protein product [Rhizophagus irregularis]